MLRFLRLLRLAFWRAFLHDLFAIAKAAAYSSILTFFPFLFIVGSGLANWRKGAPYLRELSTPSEPSCRLAAPLRSTT